jgi:hypothetical protein
MIDLRKHSGASYIGRLPMELRRIRTLESFDIPLIEEFTNERGDPFLRYWCDREGEIHRRMIFRTSPTDLAQYRVGATNTRALILNCFDQFVFMVDAVRTVTRDVFLLQSNELPSEYIPAEDSYSDPTTQIISADEQEIFINQDPLEGQSGYRQVSEYPRRFLQAYSFNALFGVNGDAGSLGAIDYKLEGGWVYHTLFNHFDAHIPEGRRARIMGVAFASPGYARFKVDPTIGSDLIEVRIIYLQREQSERLRAVESVRSATVTILSGPQ